MKAVTWHARRDVRVDDVPDPAIKDPTDVIVIGINQAQHVGSDEWWRADLRPAAEAAVPLKKR